MFVPVDVSEEEAVAAVSTGDLPAPELVASLLREAYDQYRTLDEGIVADYIPALARVSRNLFGLSVIGVNGAAYEIGDSSCEFSIQSISKPFTFALVCPRPRKKCGSHGNISRRIRQADHRQEEQT